MTIAEMERRIDELYDHRCLDYAQTVDYYHGSARVICRACAEMELLGLSILAAKRKRGRHA